MTKLIMHLLCKSVIVYHYIFLVAWEKAYKIFPLTTVFRS